jgi:hypothetical protein
LKTIDDLRPGAGDSKSRMRDSYPDLHREEEFWHFYDLAKPYSLLQIPCFYNIYRSIRYIAQRNIPGDFVECGVFLGGASIFAALARDHFGIPDRKVWMYDTFEGFPEGTQEFSTLKGRVTKGPQFENFLKDVHENIEHCGVRHGSYELIQGLVENTLMENPVPAQISMLRLDTDFYPSTKAEFRVLYPKLVQSGVLIVDDYGTWDGSRRATDEELAAYPLLLQRVTHSVYSGVKV